MDDISHVLEVPSLTVLDLQDNVIEDPNVLQLVEQMPNLVYYIHNTIYVPPMILTLYIYIQSVLYLKGNACVKEIKNYRKAIIARCKKYIQDIYIYKYTSLLTYIYIFDCLQIKISR